MPPMVRPEVTWCPYRTPYLVARACRHPGDSCVCIALIDRSPHNRDRNNAVECNYNLFQPSF
eukprot:8940333-Ditylum_brightwellii.AAC.1